MTNLVKDENMIFYWIRWWWFLPKSIFCNDSRNR